MENGKVIQLEKTKSQSGELVLTPEEKKRLADFFAVLVQIDKRLNITKTYDKPNK